MTSIVLGKFMPFHMGHHHLIESASRIDPNVCVIVGTQPHEIIDGFKRFEWVKKSFPNLNVKHLHKTLPQEPAEHVDFWNIWKRELEFIVGGKITTVFASENYGSPLAKVLGARFVPIDIERAALSVSGTAIRNDPYNNWKYIPPEVKPYYIKRILFVGGESIGKTTLCKKLADEFNTCYVPEFAAKFISINGFNQEDISLIVKGQIALRESLERKSNKIIFNDSSAVTTYIWNKRIFGTDNKEILKEEIEWDIIFSPDNNAPFVNDEHRLLKINDRKWFNKEFRNVFPNIKYLKGSLSDQLEQAKNIIKQKFSFL